MKWLIIPFINIIHYDHFIQNEIWESGRGDGGEGGGIGKETIFLLFSILSRI